MRYAVMGTVLLIGTVGAQPLGQSQQPPKPSFEVASVKKQTAFVPPPAPPSGPPSGQPSGQPASRMAFRRSNATVVSLVRFAYDVLDLQVAGGADWIRKEPFEIDAKATTDVPTDQMRLMVQSLLEDRFKLVLHKEQRDMQSYVLVTARSDGRLGSKIEKCMDPNYPPPLKSVRVPPGGNPLSGRCVAMSAVVTAAAGLMNRPVVDKTGLDGLWTYQFFYLSAGPLSAREREMARFELHGIIGHVLGVPSNEGSQTDCPL